MQPLHAQLHAQYWDSKAKRLVTEAVASLPALTSLGARLLSNTGQGSLPGIELTSQNKAYGTLSVALAPFGWALIHTASDHTTQHCTYNQHSPKASVDVQWEEPTPVPQAWFITQGLALEGIRQWAVDGTLAAGLTWSDQCS